MKTPENYQTFVQIMQRVSKWHIPRGCGQQYIPALSNTSKQTFDKPKELFAQDPSCEETITCRVWDCIERRKSRTRKIDRNLGTNGHVTQQQNDMESDKPDGDPKQNKAPTQTFNTHSRSPPTLPKW